MANLALLALDERQTNINNKIVSEPHVLTLAPQSPLRVFVLDHGRYFAKTLVVRDATGRTLQRGADKDYMPTYFYQQQSEKCGQLVAGVVTVINPAVVGPVSVDYHALGGEYPLFNKAVRDVLDTIRSGGGIIDWHNVLYKPDAYPAGRHNHEWWQSYGIDDLVEQLGRTATAIRDGRSKISTDISDGINGLPASAIAALAALNTALVNHRNDTNNPHRSTKATIGLDLVENFPVATTSELLATSPAPNRYVTPAGFAEQVAHFATTKLTAHRNDYDNPHRLTAVHFDTYVKEQFDALYNLKLGVFDRAADSLLFEGRTYAAARADVITAIPASRVVRGIMEPQRIGAGVPSSETVLDGAGNWRQLQSVFNQYQTKSTKTFFLQGFGAESNVIPYLQLNFQDMTAYPVGTVAFYNYVYGTDERPFAQVRAAVKLNANLWIN